MSSSGWTERSSPDVSTGTLRSLGLISAYGLPTVLFEGEYLNIYRSSSSRLIWVRCSSPKRVRKTLA